MTARLWGGIKTRERNEKERNEKGNKMGNDLRVLDAKNFGDKTRNMLRVNHKVSGVT
jgi:hypothetical protein